LLFGGTGGVTPSGRDFAWKLRHGVPGTGRIWPAVSGWFAHIPVTGKPDRSVRAHRNRLETQKIQS
jgi:hypothetical protein